MGCDGGNEIMGWADLGGFKKLIDGCTHPCKGPLIVGHAE